MFGFYWRQNKCFVKLQYGNRKLVREISMADRKYWELIFCPKKPGDIVIHHHHRDGKWIPKQRPGRYVADVVS